MNNNLLISVVIPSYNRAHLIKRAVESVLSQTYQNFEIIIVDDNSTDNTFNVLSQINDQRIKYIKHEKNLGATAARNTGIKAAKGEWVAFLDSDDIWLDTKLEKQVKIIPELTDDYAVIHCGMQNIDYTTNKLLTRRIFRGDIKEAVNNIGLIPGTPTMMIKKSALVDIGYFDESLPAHQESDLGLRLSQKYKFKLVDEFLVKATRNHDSINSNKDLYIKAKEIILKKHNSILSEDVKYNFCIIIAGNSIVKENLTKAKEYFSLALKYKPLNPKPILVKVLLKFFPAIMISQYRKKYKRAGLL